MKAQPGTHKLNQRELRLTELVAEGLKNREIAERIGVSSKVVKNYLSDIYPKVPVRNRVELALWYETQVHEGKLKRGTSRSPKSWM
jgi:DNA-binding NarL/FixJ family response regulator